MKASELIRKLRRRGGDIGIGPDGSLLVHACPEALEQAMRQQEHLVMAILREERASRYATAHGRFWYRSYPFSETVWGVVIHDDPGPSVNCDLEGEDVFDVLKQLVLTKRVMHGAIHQP